MSQTKTDRVVYRYEIPLDDKFHDVPAGEVVFATPDRKLDRARVEVWVLQEADDTRRQGLIVVGTGHPVPDYTEHVASVRADPFIWHVFASQGITEEGAA